MKEYVETVDDLLRKWTDRIDKKKPHEEELKADDDFQFCSLCGCFHYKNAHIFSRGKRIV